jgi:hypothetical protein
MGFFSKTCAKTNLPVVAQCKDLPRLNEIVVLLPNGKKLEGSYDGYGRVGGVDLMPDGYIEKEWDAIKFVLKEKYNNESYEELGMSGDELAQGYFMSDRFLKICLDEGSFKNYSAYKKAMEKYGDWI